VVSATSSEGFRLHSSYFGSWFVWWQIYSKNVTSEFSWNFWLGTVLKQETFKRISRVIWDLLWKRLNYQVFRKRIAVKKPQLETLTWDNRFYQIFDREKNSDKAIRWPSFSDCSRSSLSWQPILVSKLAKSAYSTLFVALTVGNRLQYHTSDSKSFTHNNLATSCKHLAKFGPVTPGFKRVKGVYTPRRSACLATFALLSGLAEISTEFSWAITTQFCFTYTLEGRWRRHCYAALATRWALPRISSPFLFPFPLLFPFCCSLCIVSVIHFYVLLMW